MTDPLTTLRAEVERLRDQAWDTHADPDADDFNETYALGRARAYDRVLDLIDKHTNVPDSCSCGGLRWVNDENWFPEHEGERVRGRAKGAGLIPCGFCNDGGWGE